MKILSFKEKEPYEADRSLARAVVKGDERAIREFMDIYFPRLYRFALVRMNDDHAAAEDVVQQTLTIAARKMSTYRGEATLMSWLGQICRRELVRHARKDRRRGQVITLFDDEPLLESLMQTLEAGDTPEQVNQRAELISMVHLVLDQLPGRNGDVLEWKYIDGLSIAEISERLGIGTEAVQSQLARARRAFKQSFSELHEMIEKDGYANEFSR